MISALGLHVMQSNRRLRALAVAFAVAITASLSATTQAQDTAEKAESAVTADSNAIEGT